MECTVSDSLWSLFSTPSWWQPRQRSKRLLAEERDLWAHRHPEKWVAVVDLTRTSWSFLLSDQLLPSTYLYLGLSVSLFVLPPLCPRASHQSFSIRASNVPSVPLSAAATWIFFLMWYSDDSNGFFFQGCCRLLVSPSAVLHLSPFLSFVFPCRQMVWVGALPPPANIRPAFHLSHILMDDSIRQGVCTLRAPFSRSVYCLIYLTGFMEWSSRLQHEQGRESKKGMNSTISGHKRDC